MKLLVNVTQADIDEGTDNPCDCPIALAATRALREAGFEGYRAEWEPYRAFCEPDGFTVWRPRWHRDGGVSRCQLAVHDCPPEAYEFASMFDDWYRYDEEDGDENEDSPPPCPCPFSFTLELPLSHP